MNDDDLKNLQRALDNQPSIADLETALDQQQRQTKAALEEMGFDVSSEKPIHFGVCQLQSEAVAINACNQLNAIAGVKAHQKRGRVIIVLDAESNQLAQEQVNKMAALNNWNVGWYSTIHKG